MSKKLKTPLKSRVSALAVASCLGGLPLMADAAGLGRITVFSALGQPLRAEVEVNANKDELSGMAARIASQEAFRQAGLEYAGALSGVKVTLDKRPSGQPVIRLTSERPVSDPFIDMLLELSWSAGRLVREYTFLLDPPDSTREAPAAVPMASAPAEAPVEKPMAKAVEKAPVKAAEKPVGTAAEKPAAKATKKPAKAEPSAAAATGDAGQPAAERMVKSGDTLSKIASAAKPEGVALEQMLVGLFRANPDAFQGQNMNRLKSGKILVIPGKETLESVAAPAARKEVLAQAQDWNAYRRKLAGVTAQEPAAETTVQKESAGKITAKVEDKAAKPAETKDQVKVSKTQSPGKQPPAVKASAEEEKVAREKALKESAERAAQLEKNVADLQKLADLKNKQLAQAQAVAKPAEPAPTPKPAEPAAPVAVEAPKPAVVPPVAPAAEVKPAEAPAPVAAAPAAPKMPETPKPKPQPLPPPEEDEGFGGALLGGVAALAAGIGGLIFYRRRKAAQESESPAVSSLSELSLGANSVFRATGGQSIDTSAATPAVTDFSQTGPGTIDTDEVDPVAEAEVYMAYGRDAQAEEILLEALQKDSKRLAIHLKLLEIYAQRKSNKQFETLATELYAQTGGNGPEWEKAVAMGVKLDPANPLYSAGSTGAASPFAVVAAATAAGEGFDPDATVLAGPADSIMNRAGFAASPVAGDVAAVEMEPVKTAENPLSFDLNVDELPTFDEPALAPFAATDTVVKAAPAPTATLDSDAMALDFDLDLGSTVATPSAGAAAPDVDLGGESFDFDLNLGDSEVAPSLLASEIKKPDLSAISLDLGEPTDRDVMDLDKTMLAASPTSDATVTNLFGIDSAVAEAADAGSPEEQAVATKLDLAKAYEEMGDAEGARELLQEVITEGTSAQKEAANAMLARLA